MTLNLTAPRPAIAPTETVLRVTSRAPRSARSFVTIPPGTVWRSPAAFMLAAVIQNTSDKPLYIVFADRPLPATDGRQISISPLLADPDDTVPGRHLTGRAVE